MVQLLRKIPEIIPKALGIQNIPSNFATFANRDVTKFFGTLGKRQTSTNLLLDFFSGKKSAENFTGLTHSECTEKFGWLPKGL